MLSKLETKGAESALFFRHWLRHPLEIGAFLPSSAAVGRAMAKAAAFDRPGTILELGGGTGAVTASLLEAGCAAERLVVVEREVAMAALLRRRFANVRVVEGDACAIGSILAELGVTRLAAIVSSLPIKWFPIAGQRAVIMPCLDLADDDGSFIQLTNAMVSPVATNALGLSGIEIARVWSQFPPVQIWQYRRRQGEGNAMTHLQSINRYRSIWISDVHLGTRGCKAEFLLDFLRHTESEFLYLVGDIVDGWRLKKSWYWAQSHNDVIQKILRKARKGTKVIYVPGNHDEMLRDYTGLHFGGVLVESEIIHMTADGKRMLVIHGDAFDGVVRYARWLALLGDWAYDLMLWLNNYYNHARRLFGYPYWSLSAYLKARVKNAVQFVGDYANAITTEARARKVDGIICGHIHQAEMRDINGVLYCNDGDWVESCTALVEHFDGTLEVLHWMALRACDPFNPPDEHELALLDEDA